MRFTLVPAVALAISLLGPSAHADQVRLRLEPAMVINESGLGHADWLVDEQTRVADLQVNAATRPERAFFAGWQPDLYPAHLIVDLGTDQRAEVIRLFNESGENRIQTQTGTPFNWTQLQETRLGGYRHWVEVRFPEPTRYVRLTLNGPVSLPEMVAFGTAKPPATSREKTPSPKMRPERPAFGSFLGVNAFIDDPIERIAPVAGLVREYHNWGWDLEHPDHRVRFQPSGAAGGNLWFFDDFYRKLGEAKVEVAPCLQGSIPWMTGEKEAEAKPVAPNSDPADPASYKAHSAHLFQMAARYGKTAVADGLLVLADDQPRQSGLNLVRFFENANEPDKTWKGRAGRSTPFEFAAQCSADYDGHQGKLGPGHGVRSADRSARLVLGGLYRDPLMYLDAMRFWAEHHRGGVFPADVINVHVYCGDGDEQQALRTRGVAPEIHGLRARLAEIVAWRDQHVPAAEIWVSEFGYDTHPGSPLHAPALGMLSAEEVQGAWLARGFFAMTQAGVDRAMMFMFRDVDASAPGVFATSGLVTAKGEWKPKASWYYQATLKTHLGQLHYAGDVKTTSADVVAVRFESPGRTALAVWSATSEDRRIKDVSLEVPGSRAKRVDLVVGSTEGRATDLMVKAGSVRLDVSEVPCLILID